MFSTQDVYRVEKKTFYGELSPRRTPLGPDLAVRLREVCALYRVNVRHDTKKAVTSRIFLITSSMEQSNL